MKTEKTTGLLFITGVIGVTVPYIILSIIFEYPDILRHETGVILTRFYEGGATLIITWWAFAILGLPLLIATILIGQRLSHQLPFTRWVTTIGVIGLLVQMIGLLRWVFVVPVLAEDFKNGSEVAREASEVAFQVIHQYGGVVLGEHLGQLFTIIWTVAMTHAFSRLHLFPRWTTWLGYAASLIYFLAQGELFATVIPGFPVIEMAGFLGSTLWLIWLLIIGILIRKKNLG